MSFPVNFGQVHAAWPLLGSVLSEVLSGIRAGLTNDQIRERLSRSDVVSDSALVKIRHASVAVSGFIDNG